MKSLVVVGRKEKWERCTSFCGLRMILNDMIRLNCICGDCEHVWIALATVNGLLTNDRINTVQIANDINGNNRSLDPANHRNIMTLFRVQSEHYSWI